MQTQKTLPRELVPGLFWLGDCLEQKTALILLKYFRSSINELTDFLIKWKPMIISFSNFGLSFLFDIVKLN
jgi:hypothetical protein